MSSYLTLVPFLMFVFHGTPVTIRDAFGAAARPLLASVLTAGLLLLLSPMINMQPVPALAISLSIAVFAYLALSLAMPGGRDRLKKYVAYARMGFRPAAVSTGELST